MSSFHPHRSLHDPFALEERTAIITGAARGIGLEIAREFVSAGAKVLLVDIAREELADALVGLPEGRVGAFVGDIGQSDTAHAMVDEVMGRWHRLDTLVCNAGIARRAALDAMSEGDWDDVLRTNLKGVFIGMQAASAVMCRQRAGSIVNISSIGAQQVANAGYASYVASKAGVIGLTRAGALELAPYNVRVNAVAPGAVESSMLHEVVSVLELERAVAEIPLGRLGQPSDIARAVRFLASDAASWITGQVLSVNGGKHMIS